jgi:hypothetical protein
MQVSHAAAEALADAAKEMGYPVAAPYVLRDGVNVFVRRLCTTSLDGRAITGLGCVAVPLAALERLAARSRSLWEHGEEVICFTSTAWHDGAARYCREDEYLAHELGGYGIAQVTVGHRGVYLTRAHWDSVIAELQGEKHGSKNTSRD